MGLLEWLYKRKGGESVHWFKGRLLTPPHIIAMLRVRNEELILQDTLDHLGEFADGIVCYDDCSSDRTPEIARSHPKVIGLIRSYSWSSDPEVRIRLETEHRAKLVAMAQTLNPVWLFYADADERFVGDIRGFTLSAESENVDVVRVMLFDAYMTKDDQRNYESNQRLLNFRTYFGPERRDIVMLWRAANKLIRYEGLDSREPSFPPAVNVVTRFYCQHYGKSLSVQQWEETCDYYVNHFPYEPYGRKWESRRGKAIHIESDFGRPLYEWGHELFRQATKIN